MKCPVCRRNELRDTRVTFRLEPTLLERLHELAGRRRPVAPLIRRAVADFLERRPNPPEAA